MTALILTLTTVFPALTQRLSEGLRRRDGERGASTLELVILILGLVAVATMLVAALTAAVKSRTDQIV
jgi:hypothetical protein